MCILCHWDNSHGTTEVMGKSDAWFPTQRYSRKALLQSVHLAGPCNATERASSWAVGCDATEHGT